MKTWFRYALIALALNVAQCSMLRADEIYDWSNAAANNNNAPPDGFPENMNYSEVNDAARELMAVVKRYVEAVDGTNTTAGTEPAYTLTSGQSLAAAAGHVHVWTAHATSTGSATLNVDAAGAKNVVDAGGTQLGSGAIVSGGVYMTVETASAHRVIGSIAATPVAGPASSTDNALARFNGAGGSTIQNSGVIVDDSNNVTGMGTLSSGAITSSGSLTGTTVELGGVTDTTLARSGAGDATIESNVIYRAGGTDVAIADGGTGASTAADAFTALKQAASETATGVVELATTAEAETGTDTARAVTPAGVLASINANAGSGLTLGTPQATTSGTSIDITGLTACVDRATILFDDVDTSGADHLLVQIGDSGGIETTSYESSSGSAGASTSSTSGFIIAAAAGDDQYGIMTLVRITGNRWISSHAMGDFPVDQPTHGGGGKTLSAALDRIRLSGGTFNSGQIAVHCE